MPPAIPFPQGVPWSLNPSGTFLSFDSGPFQLRIYKDSGHIAFAGPDLAGTPSANVIQFSPPGVETANGSFLLGRVITSKAIVNGLEVTQALGPAQITARLTFPHNGVMRYELTDWGGVAPIATAVAAPSDASEHFYGLGEKFDAVDQAGKKVRVLTFDDPGTKADHSYKVAPWFVSTRGYGFHLDSSAESHFDLRSGAPDRFVITNLFSTLRFNVVYGPKLTDVLSRYTSYTGQPPLPPPWAFGPWISSDIWRSGGEVRYAVTQFRERDIPVSAFVFDSPWETAYNDFHFNMAQFGKDATFEGVHYPGFASVSELMNFLRSNGLKVICWMAPFVNVSSDDEKVVGQNLGKASNYDQGATNGFFVRASAGGPPLVVPWWKGRGSPIDFTNPAAKAWVTNQLKDLLTQSNVVTKAGTSEPVIGGFKTDDGESGNGPNTYIPTTAQYADGRTGVEMRNGYCLEYHKTVWSVLGVNGVLFARSGFAGTQAFPGCWAGDNEPNFGDNGLPSVIIAGQSAAMSGYAIWGHDVGGYQDTNFSQSPPNLFMRWAQFGCFSPIMQMHRQVGKELQYPWRYGDLALQNYKFFTRLHTQLFPYIYTYAKEASTSGLPIIRPLVLLNQTDANTFENKFTFHFGNELLVAPMIAPNSNTRQIYLPAGNWFDFWTNAKHAGGQTIIWTNTQQSQMPLFVREGAIVPMLLTDVQTLCDANYVNNPNIKSPDDGLLLLIYPGGTSQFTVYDGTQVQCAVNGATTVVTLTSAARPVMLQILGVAPTAISRDGAALPQRETQAAFDATDTGWRFDPSTRFISVKFQHSGGSTKIAVETKIALALGVLPMSVSVLTQHNDNIRSGANLLETKLNTTNVDVNNFGLVASRDVEGLTYAQPLYVPNVMISGASKNVVYVATMENWLYAFDADDLTPGGTFLWKKQLHPHPVPAHFYGANYNDITGDIGILSTPVADPASNTIYVVAAAYEPNVLSGPAAQAQQAFKQLLFALDLSTGNLRLAAAGAGNPVEIGGSVPGVGYFDAQESSKPVDKTGGDAKVAATITDRDAQGNPLAKNFIVADATAGKVIFSPMQEMQRPALLLANGVLYIAFGSHGDIDPYHGWVFAYDAATLKQRGVFSSTPNGGQGGIWQAGEGLVADAAGNIYCGSGNGDSKNNAANGPDLGETFIRLRASASSLDLNAFFTVFQDATNPVFDEDLGAASPTILPDGFLVGGGKDGNFYLIDPSKLTNAGSPGALAQQFLATRGPGSRARIFFNDQEVSTHHIHGSPTVYNSPNHGPLVYVWGENNVLRAYRYDPAAHNFPEQPNQRNAEGTATAHGTLFASNDSAQRRGMPGAMLSISADGQTPGSAILWASFPPFEDANQQIVDGMLAAYDATQFDAQGRLVLLWHSHQNPGQDDVGKFAKFCCPTIADGKVFLATFSNKLRIYGRRAKPDGGYNFAFGGKTGLTLNGSARSNGGPIRLAGMHLFQAGGVFSTQPVNVAKFTTTFRFQLLGQNSADGIVFCVQGEGPRALGGPGGGLGYGPDPLDPLDPGFKITKSVALKFGLFDSLANQPRSLMGLYQNGNSPIAANAIGGEISLDAIGIDLHSGHQFRVTLTYDGTTLQAALRDLTLQTEITRAFTINIPAITGNTAFVGFTGGTGGFSANEDILSWQFTS